MQRLLLTFIPRILYYNGWLRVGGLEEVVEKASDSEGADAAFDWSDGGEVFSGIEFGGEVAFYYSVFWRSAGIYKSGARGNKITIYQPRYARGTYDYIKLLKFCQVVATVKEGDVVVWGCEDFV